MSGYRKLKVWSEAHQLTLKVYEITRNFPKDERFGLISQLRRAALSVPTNIAEGQGRSNNKEFINFLRIAKGSISEVEYLVFVSYELGYIQLDMYDELSSDVQKVMGMISNLITSLHHFPKNK